MSQLTRITARIIYWFTVDVYMELSKKIESFMRESLVTTSEVTDAQEKRISFKK